jgi:hypothetical protein
LSYYGLPTYTLQNNHLQLDVLAEAGPRIVRLFCAGMDENLLAETPQISWPTPYGEFHIWGGHRLWHAPEAYPRTYYPDDLGLKLEPLANGARLTGTLEIPTGIRKELEIHLAADRPAVRLVHRLVNEGPSPVELAPWAITQFPLGGTIQLPQPDQPVEDDYQPNRCLALWRYTRLHDPRLELADDFIRLHARADPQAIKIGYRNTHGWAAYERNGVRLVKRFTPAGEEVYPDYGCNVEAYCKDQFCELETLGPLKPIPPGQTVTHVEEWEITHYTGRFRNAAYLPAA